MKKRYTCLAALILSTSSYSQEALPPERSFILKMSVIYQEIEHIHFNGALLADLSDREVIEKYTIIKKYLTRHDFDQVIQSEHNPLIKDRLIEIAEDIIPILSSHQKNSSKIKNLVKLINNFYSVLFEEHSMNFFCKSSDRCEAGVA